MRARELEIIGACGEGAPSLDDKVRYLRAIRGQAHSASSGQAEAAEQIDRYLVSKVTEQRQALLEAQKAHQQLTAMVEQLIAPPSYPAMYLGLVQTSQGERALVAHNGAKRLVALADGFSSSECEVGEEVLLNGELNAALEKCSVHTHQHGETAIFDRYTADGRLILRSRDEEHVVAPTPRLANCQLRNGDLVRWDRQLGLAFETVERPSGDDFFLSEVSDITADQVGGQDENMEILRTSVIAPTVAPAAAESYGLSGARSVLMIGPPGCGKTLMARFLASELGRVGGRECRFGVVKPAQWWSPYVGQTEANIRNAFQALHDAADECGFAMLFMDEVEATGRIRGSMGGQHSDRFLAALLTEIDGFKRRGNTAIVSATNRKDLVDPALLDRISDIEITVGRPRMQAARDIFAIHLAESYPYSENGFSAGETRREMIETAVSRFYSPNGENEICRLRFRDGTTRMIAARELLSGRMIAQVCKEACRRAFVREVGGGERGLRVDDMEHAVAKAIDRLASTLSIQNCHFYLADLPQDLDVVSVEVSRPRAVRTHQYLNAA